MLFYISLTTFRMLSISFAIVTLGYIAIPLYVFLLLGIIIIGYLKTSKDADFIVRGLVSALTTGDSHIFIKSIMGVFQRECIFTVRLTLRPSPEGVSPTDFLQPGQLKHPFT